MKSRLNEQTQFETDIAALESFGHRGSATDEESQAATMLAQRLAAMGCDVETEAFASFPSLGGRLFVHVIGALQGLAVCYQAPGLAALVTVIVGVSFLLESTTRFSLLSRLLPRPMSINTMAHIRSALPATKRIILCAHIDSQRTGWIWNTRVVRAFARTKARAPGPLKAPMVVFTLSLLIQIIAITIILADGPVLWPLIWILAALFAVAAVLTLQWATSPFIPGACDNASGVAAALTLVERWKAHALDHVELIVLLTGSEEVGAVGASAWLDAHQDELGDLPLLFLNIDMLGTGPPRLVASECGLSGFMVNYPPDLLAQASEVTRQLGDDSRPPIDIAALTDGLAFLVRGVPGLTVTSNADGYFVPRYHQVSDQLKNMDLSAAWQAIELAWSILQSIAQLESAAELGTRTDGELDFSIDVCPP